MRGVGVEDGFLAAGGAEAELALVHASHEGFDEKHLGELGAVVEECCTEVGVDFVNGSELCGWGSGAVEVRGLKDEARVGRGLEVGQEGEDQVCLCKVVYLHVAVEAIGGFPVLAYAKAGVADKL